MFTFFHSELKDLHCIEENGNFIGMPKFWEWLSYADYEGTTKVREVVFDQWGTNVSFILILNNYR